jgi:hypothetical protein
MPTTISPRHEFARSATISRALQRRLSEDAQRKKREEEKEREQDRADSDLIDLAQTVMWATETRIREFELNLDRHDAATVEALMENERELLEVRERIAERLEQALVLPDGRRVFKSEDGTRVFDEYGVELSPDVITPDEIPDHLDRFEPYWQDRATESGLVDERDQLIEHQQFMDSARERYEEVREQGGGRVGEDFLDDLEAEIDAATPERVRHKLGLSVQADHQPVRLGSDITHDRVSTNTGPQAPIPGG